MPYQQTFVPAELFLEHNGVSVFHTYKDDDIDQPRWCYWFAMSPELGEADAFDVRKLSTWSPDGSIEEAIIKAVETGELKPEN